MDDVCEACNHYHDINFPVTQLFNLSMSLHSMSMLCTAWVLVSLCYRISKDNELQRGRVQERIDLLRLSYIT